MIDLLIHNRPLLRQILKGDYEKYCKENLERVILEGFKFSSEEGCNRYFNFGKHMDLLIQDDTFFVYFGFNGRDNTGGYLTNEDHVEKLRNEIASRVLKILIND